MYWITIEGEKALINLDLKHTETREADHVSLSSKHKPPVQT